MSILRVGALRPTAHITRRVGLICTERIGLSSAYFTLLASLNERSMDWVGS